MNQESMTFLLDKDKKIALEAIASTTKNTINDILNEAVTAISIDWQVEEIKQALTTLETLPAQERFFAKKISLM